MNPYVDLITAAASFVIVLRLCTFSGIGHKQKLGMSALAWVTIFLSGAQGISILFFAAPVSISTMGLTLIIAFLVLKTKGNMSCLMRIKNELV